MLKRKPPASQLLYVAAIVTAGWLSGPAFATCEDGTSDGAACCWNELLKITTGQTMSQTVINNYKGGQNPIDSWNSGGSQDIAALCQAADYWKSGDPSWFLEYFDDQAVNIDAGGHQGSEVLSPLHSPDVVAAVMAGLEKANQLGHTAVKNEAESWLRAYWAINALAAHPRSYSVITSVTSAEESGLTTDGVGNGAFYEGLTTPIAGMRRLNAPEEPLALEQPSLHVGQFLLTLALDWQPRRLSYTDLGTDSFYNALRVVVHLLGGGFNKNGSLDFDQVPAPAAKFGLTTNERQKLVNFVNNPGAYEIALNEVLAMIPYGAQCTITFLRTTHGTSVWFGDDEIAQERCNHSAPSFGVTMNHSGEATFLSPVEMEGLSFDRSRRSGSKIEAWRSQQPASRVSIDVIGGSTLYKVVWGSAGVVVREFGSDPSPLVSVTATDSSAAEGPSPNTGQFTLTRTGSTTSALTVQIFITGTAGNGLDYSGIPSTHTFPVGQAALTITVTPLNDDLLEGLETVRPVVIPGSGYAVGSPSSATVNLSDDEAAAHAGFHDGIDCNGTYGWAWDSTRPTTPITVAIFDGSTLLATVLADHFRQDLLNAGIGDGRHGWGFTLPQSVRDGNPHTITVKYGGSNVNLGNTPKTIQCQALPTVSLVATDAEASEAGNNGQFTLSRTGPTTSALTVSMIVGGTASNITDYNSIHYSQTFAVGESSKVIVVRPNNDTVREGLETVTLEIGASSSYFTGSPSLATVNLLDDDYIACTSGGTVLCLLSGRFEVTLSAVANGTTYPGQTIGASNASGAFWLFSSDNVEVGVKVLDGSGINGNFWVYHGAATDLAYTVTVKDRANPTRIKTYSKAAGTYCGGSDLGAFTRSQLFQLEAPADGLASRSFACAPDTTTACVQNGRFQVRVKRGTAYQPIYGSTASTVGFWFFSSDNLEVLAKVIDGTAVNGKYWVYFGSLTDQAFTLEVTDSVTEIMKSYSRTAAQSYCGGGDTVAF